jgi:hypothetical protein
MNEIKASNAVEIHLHNEKYNIQNGISNSQNEEKMETLRIF